MIDREDEREPILDGSSLGEENTSQIADQMFMDAVLARFHHRESAAQRIDQNIKLAFERIDVQEARRTPSHRIQSRTIRWGLPVAAVLLMGATVLFLMSGPTAPSAQATISRSLEIARQEKDRHYAVHVSREGGVSLPLDLWVRGGERFVVRIQRPIGTMWFGQNHDQVWLIPAIPLMPVLASGNRGLLTEWIAQQDFNMPFLQITSILEKLEGNYDLSVDSSHEDRLYIHAMLSTPLLAAPDEVRLEIESKSGIALRVDLRWAAPALGSMSFELVDSDALEIDFYQHNTHHDAGRSVLEPR